ncbi:MULTISPECIES: pyrophosphate--fructose-6-phosphate 1-phosphotransferase [Sinorhizobium/Ensifer group]|jgi:pyrophosphate--fructose-6-phosphate 1-phosphotransferase|uniref:pyrophosphate--fructose-6-phosphate 1-phosphotransferase n=1 Tax=Sinorhizobium/Ensifer group TaxID=227292 RepID=UPI00070D0250|nr:MULTISPECIES: pyrophosphate--fructose-6-phosphate 1-phosphotransferase [Sinorhizobium/Ensifer group]KRD53017.1 pyrophosphate--fructose-6-phosphate 1-phosphotransferase [Ensifer sp. Root278]KSV76895.1 pyrophosphate--fructose-6-phosphate 1-phosphotransferase [Sinorhizobium sp. Sb3]KSV94143.1 pyrophosphate--fructose-6-phosphate 1-phosphotransferase [Sinorhizobium sp. GL28]MBD9507281.1 pyrophosphate--fructose-6-phosphate 1-phosphotransferase [Ensifer sp. ENS10]MBV7517519.1 pyrophosphate--fructo
MAKKKVAMLTAGGLAPCLSSAVGGLIERYTDVAPEYELVAYRSGYQGVLLGDRIEITRDMREKAHLLHRHGGSPIGNSRVKLTNAADCVKRGLVKDGENPLRIAAERLANDGISILHTIGGDDTNTTAADLAAYLGANGYNLTVVGLPKTVDNDVVPIRQTLGAWTAAEYGARFFDNVSNEQSAAPRTLVVHEVMGRHCGWLTAATARSYIQTIDDKEFVDGFMMNRQMKNIDGLYLPEMKFDLQGEADRLRKIMDRTGFVTLFVSEGACLDAIVTEREAAGETIKRDAFGHVKIDTINVGNWFSKQFAALLGAERAMVQKSGYYARSAPANGDDLRLIQSMVDLAVESALNKVSGVTGHDEDQGGKLRTIEFPRIKGGKQFDTSVKWFGDVMDVIGQKWQAQKH